jgi:tetratricopeptide (TPR) repeat protein
MKIDLYETLDLTIEANEQEIKKAYFKKIREFPAEKEPEMFRKIRQAYETLSNENSRAEYDALATYGEEIQHLLDEGQTFLNNGDFKRAGQFFKKILMIEPTFQTARNYYALSLAYSGEYDKAFTQFDRLIKKSPENATYFYNYGFTLVKANRFDEGTFYLSKALRLDPSDVNILFSIVDCYVDNKNFQKARQTIEREMDNLVGQSNFQMVYLFKLLEVNIISSNQQEVDQTIERIDRWVLINPDELNSVTRELSLLAIKFAKAKRYNIANLLIHKALKHEPDNEVVQGIYQDISRDAPIFIEMKALEDDEKVLDSVKNVLMLYVHGDEVSEEKFEEFQENFFNNLRLSCMYDSEAAIKSIKYILIHYPNLYEIRKGIFQEAIKLAKEYQEIDQQYERMQKDSYVTNGIKRLISLYLSEVPKEERDEYFDDIMDELSDEPKRSVYRSITRLETYYPSLVNLNPDFMKKLKDISQS